MKKIFLLIFILLPTTVFASDFQELESTTKYYKTVSFLGDLNLFAYEKNVLYKTYEISRDEYNSMEIGNNYDSLSNGYIETNYKKLTTSILSNGNYYRYKTILEWKTMPKIRSYDVIGIGFYASVKVKTPIYFNQYYCITAGSCINNSEHIFKKFDTGVGCIFKLPSYELDSLKQTLYFDVDKNTSSTIVSQKAFGDYSHAVKIISLTNAQKFNVNSTGIQFDTAITSYYDAISTSIATWSGSW